MGTILVVEPDFDLHEYYARALDFPTQRLRFLSTLTDLIQCSDYSAEYSLVVLNDDLTKWDAVGTIDMVGSQFSDTPLIVLCSEGEESHATRSLPGPFHRTLMKPICFESLRVAAEGILATKSSHQDRDLTRQGDCDLDVGSTWSQRIEPLLRRVGAANVPVLLQGETGVGKEVIARRLHSYSERADGPFVKLNCAALPSELIESELFGYERGAFTGAFKSTPGKFEMAQNGTILLDEIGDMDFRLQAKLLQVLQDQEFFRLGSKESSRVDVRVMAASHCDFERAIHENRFREDLYYRLNIIDIKIPPLRERRAEILPLCEHFLEKHATGSCPRLEITPILRQVVMEYDWPGNVRELENAMRKYLVLRSPSILASEIRKRTMRARAVYVPPPYTTQSSRRLESGSEERSLSNISDTGHAKAHSGTRTPDHSRRELSPSLHDFTDEDADCGALSNCVSIDREGAESALSKVDQARRAAEAQAILHALNSSLWNRKRAATLLNVDYKALLYKMKKLGIGDKRPASVI